jgi:hypothetical protein
VPVTHLRVDGGGEQHEQKKYGEAAEGQDHPTPRTWLM